MLFDGVEYGMLIALAFGLAILIVCVNSLQPSGDPQKSIEERENLCKQIFKQRHQLRGMEQLNNPPEIISE